MTPGFLADFNAVRCPSHRILLHYGHSTITLSQTPQMTHHPDPNPDLAPIRTTVSNPSPNLTQIKSHATRHYALLAQDWIRRLRVLLQQGATIEGSPEQQQLNWLMEQYAQVCSASKRCMISFTCLKLWPMHECAFLLSACCMQRVCVLINSSCGAAVPSRANCKPCQWYRSLLIVAITVTLGIGGAYTLAYADVPAHLQGLAGDVPRLHDGGGTAHCGRARASGGR